MIYIATQGDTWDSIAYKTTGDEFQFVTIIENNRDLCDVVQFDGGERVYIPDSIDNIYRIATSPWQSTPTVSVIKAPWS